MARSELKAADAAFHTVAMNVDGAMGRAPSQMKKWPEVSLRPRQDASCFLLRFGLFPLAGEIQQQLEDVDEVQIE